MISKLKDYLIGIAFGVRYRANFSIEDQLGQMVDQILYSKNSYFNPEIFPNVLTNINEKVLLNENSGDKLIINNSNVILEINFGESFEISMIDAILDNFNKEILEGILKKYKITQINRIGLINRYLFREEELAKSFINTTIGATLEGINDINLRFSKKIPSQESIVKKDVNDYNNIIFNVIKKANRKELFTSIDVQKYFDPFLVSVLEVEFAKFLDYSNSFNSNNFLKWLNKNYGNSQ